MRLGQSSVSSLAGWFSATRSPSWAAVRAHRRVARYASVSPGSDYCFWCRAPHCQSSFQDLTTAWSPPSATGWLLILHRRRSSEGKPQHRKARVQAFNLQTESCEAPRLPRPRWSRSTCARHTAVRPYQELSRLDTRSTLYMWRGTAGRHLNQTHSGAQHRCHRLKLAEPWSMC